MNAALESWTIINKSSHESCNCDHSIHYKKYSNPLLQPLGHCETLAYRFLGWPTSTRTVCIANLHARLAVSMRDKSNACYWCLMYFCGAQVYQLQSLPKNNKNTEPVSIVFLYATMHHHCVIDKVQKYTKTIPNIPKPVILARLQNKSCSLWVWALWNLVKQSITIVRKRPNSRFNSDGLPFPARGC